MKSPRGQGFRGLARMVRGLPFIMGRSGTTVRKAGRKRPIGRPVHLFFAGKKMEVRDAARCLFMNGFSQQFIARSLRKSDNTIKDWKRRDGWEEAKLKADTHQQSSEEGIRELIDYQLTALKELKDIWISERKAGERPKLIERGEIDALQKLYSAIRPKEQGWENAVRTVKDIMEWLEREYPGLAKEFASVAPLYTESKRKNG